MVEIENRKVIEEQEKKKFGKGNLIFRVTVEIPRDLSQKQKELLEEFAKSCGETNNRKQTSFFKKFLNNLKGDGKKE